MVIIDADHVHLIIPIAPVRLGPSLFTSFRSPADELWYHVENNWKLVGLPACLVYLNEFT